jgi:hypothetical protein
MVLTKRRLIVVSVAIAMLLLLFKVTTSFFDESPAGGSRDFEQAVHELLEEADRGSAQAHYRLGRFFEEGLGIPRDVVKAHAWYTLAAAQGMLEASMARDALAHEMTREQLAESYRLAIEWSSPGEAGIRVADASPNPLRGTINEDADAALSDGDATMVSNHLAAGLDPDAVDKNGETLLNRAVESGNIAVVEAVLDAGADVNASGKGGRTPLSIAAAAGREDVVALLVDRGADPALADSDPTDPEPGATDSGISGEISGEISGAIPGEISRAQPELDGFETAAGREDAAGADVFDTASREKISRDLLGATAGDGRTVAVATLEEPSEQASRQPAASPPIATQKTAAPTEPTGDRAAAPAGSRKIQQARIGPDIAATPPPPRPARKASAGVASPPPVPGTRVRTAQYLLARLGYDPGPADGLAGPKTQAAVRAYRKDKGEPDDGGITAALVSTLDADVVAEESRRLAKADATQAQDSAGRPRRENRDVWVNLLGGVQKLLGLEFDSTKDPGKMRVYCAKNTENWIYDFGTERFVLCRDLVNGEPTVSR